MTRRRSIHCDPDQFYAALREAIAFRRTGHNVEGILFVDGVTLCLFQRGNARRHDGLQPVDATGDVDFR